MCLSPEILSAYVDGDLEPAESSRARDHLAACGKCRLMEREIQAIKAVAQEVDSKTPVPDLWPAISARLDRPRFIDLFRAPIAGWAVAAALVVLIALLVTRPEPAAPPEIAELAAARATYLAAIARLETAARPARDRLPEDAKERVIASLELVDRAIAECEAELRRHPADPLGEQMLLALYDEKIRVLDASIEAAHRGGER
jgi:anti-sigma factor RsiW